MPRHTEEGFKNILLLGLSKVEDGFSAVELEWNGYGRAREAQAVIEGLREKGKFACNMRGTKKGVAGVNGTVAVQADGVWIYFVVTSEDYPERHAFKLLNDFTKVVARESLQRSLAKCTKPGGATRACEDVFLESVRKYDDLAGLDKVSQVQAKVAAVTAGMEQNIQLALDNQESLDGLSEKTAMLEQGADKFRKQARTAKRGAWWKNMKLNVCVGMIVLAVAAAMYSWLIGFGDNASSE